MFEAVLKRILQAVFEASVDHGVADATSAVNRLDDSSKDWPVDAFTNLIVEITDGTGEGQIRKIDSNTATSLVPVTDFTTAPDATSQYRIGFFGKMASDITAWGGTALTGRNISLDLANLDIALSALRDAVCDTGASARTLDDLKTAIDAVTTAVAALRVASTLDTLEADIEALLTGTILAAGTNLIGKVNPQSEAGAGQAPVGVNVTNASTEILATNAIRKVGIVCNDSDTTMWLAIGQAAVAHQGIRLNANGGTLVISKTGDIYTTEAINGILAVAGPKVATAQELN